MTGHGNKNKVIQMQTCQVIRRKKCSLISSVNTQRRETTEYIHGTLMKFGDTGMENVRKGLVGLDVESKATESPCAMLGV